MCNYWEGGIVPEIESHTLPVQQTVTCASQDNYHWVTDQRRWMWRLMYLNGEGINFNNMELNRCMCARNAQIHTQTHYSATHKFDLKKIYTKETGVMIELYTLITWLTAKQYVHWKAKEDYLIRLWFVKNVWKMKHYLPETLVFKVTTKTMR